MEADKPHGSTPRVALLGVAEWAAYVNRGHPALSYHNLLGLRSTLLNYFYPCTGAGWSIVVSIFDPLSFGKSWIRIIDEKETQLLRLDVGIQVRDDNPPQDALSTDGDWRAVAITTPTWFTFHQSLSDLFVSAPGRLAVVFGSESTPDEIPLGFIDCLVLNPPPLTEARKAAIKANPRASKYARVQLKCKLCSSLLYVYSGIDRPSTIDGIAHIWHEEAPDTWICQCGSSTISLESIRSNLHGVLDTAGASGRDQQSELTFVRMYEGSSLAQVCERFAALLDENPREQVVQSFLEQNTILLHRFCPTRLIIKAPILTKHVTDFAILDPRGGLVLIEIEPPSLRILRKNGEMTHHLNHAFEQVRFWLEEVRRHRTAIIDCLGLSEQDVVDCRGVVIAGRNRDYPSKHVMHLKGIDHGDVEFFTYDDILEGVIRLSQELRSQR